MLIRVPYGDSWQEAMLDEGTRVQVIDVPDSPVAETPSHMIGKAMEEPIGTPRLEDMVTPSDEIVIIMNDQTRPGPNEEMLAEIMARLHAAGVNHRQVQVVIATGTHRGPTEEELDTIMGERYHQELRIHIHDSQDGCHVHVGDTRSGMPVWIDRHVANAGFVIAAGVIAPHHTAGFSGGRKSIVPGVAGMETLKIHHSLPIRPYEPAMGVFEENPFHLAALEAARLARIHFIVNAVQDAHKQTVACVAGDMEAAHQAGVQICRRVNTVAIRESGHIIITSPGGSPRDCNLYQSQKAVSVAEMFAKKTGAKFILCARAEDGIGGRLLQQWLEEAKSPQEVIDRFAREGFQAGNNKAFMFARALKKGEVIVVSDFLDRTVLGKMMLSWAPDLQSAVNQALEPDKNQRIIVLPQAVNIIPEVTDKL